MISVKISGVVRDRECVGKLPPFFPADSRARFPARGDKADDIYEIPYECINIYNTSLTLTSFIHEIVG